MDKKLATVLTGLVLSVFALTACGGNKTSWAYIHDPGTEILSLSDNGKAEYKGSNYTYTKDDSFITLKGSDGSETKMRYVPDDSDEDKMILYESSVYQLEGDGSKDGVIGLWKQDNGWSFEFTEKGTFAEEKIFFGHYIVDEDAKTIKLMYDEPMEDAILYYSREGDELTIDYPWPMIKTGKDTGNQSGSVEVK